MANQSLSSKLFAQQLQKQVAASSVMGPHTSVYGGAVGGGMGSVGAGGGGAAGGGMRAANPPGMSAAMANGGSGAAGGNANVGAPQQGTRGKPSDARFRSFAERFMIARAHLFRADPPGLAEDTWSCILDAKRAYAMIARTGQNIEPEEGAGF